MASAAHIPLSVKMNMAGNIAMEWKRFRDQWRNYELAADLNSESDGKCAAIFLACIGCEAYELYQTLEFADDEHRRNIDKVVEAFDHRCIGEINVTYERYVFNRRTREVGEPFDDSCRTFDGWLKRVCTERYRTPS